MKCISCGANQTPNDNSGQIKCDYCGSYSPNESFLFLKLKQKEPQDTSINFEELSEHENYSVLREKCLKSISESPNYWNAYIYLAISEFWLGTNDFKHIEIVFKNFRKSYNISKNENILEYINTYAESTISLASHNKHFGEELTNSLNTFRYIDSLNIQLSEDVKEQRIEYCKSAINRFVENIDNGLKIKKDKFDITYNILRDFYYSLAYMTELKYYEKFYLIAKFHLTKNKSKSYVTELNGFINNIQDVLKQDSSTIKGKNITFNMFGKLKIK